MTILDAGCGPGRLAIPLSVATGTSGEVVAMDAQEAMTAIVERKALERGLQNVRLLASPLGVGALKAEYFDRAVLVTVLGEIPDRECAMSELYRALKPGGILSITETVFDPHYQNRATVLRLAESVGFRLRATFGNRLAYTVHFEKWSAEPSAPSDADMSGA
jgi:ubiquinone/menaquinone biosynthesis C-methylase UbiE